MKNIIEIMNLSKNFGPVMALDNITVNIPAGKIVGLLGPNGSGKTTLIKILANLLMNYEGDILVNGHHPGMETKKIISYLPDCNYLSPKWTSKDAIAYFKDFYTDFDEKQAFGLLQKLNINPNQKFKFLSKGTKEKLQLILVLSRRAKVYLFDEPIAGVDPAARDLIFRLILENYNQEASIIISTHLISEVEEIIDYALFLKSGSLLLFDEADTIRAQFGKSLNAYFKEVYRC